jgi:hypothetical protein
MPRNLSKDWILSYAEGLDKYTEAPTSYLVWVAISLVGAVMKKRVYRKRGIHTIYPNQYVVLTGPPGIGKGEAIHPAYNLAKEAALVNVISDRVTAPKIIDRIANGFGPGVNVQGGQVKISADSTAVLLATELAGLLTASDFMMQFLCDAFDRNTYEYDTKNSGTSVIKGMCTSLMGACVPDYIRKLNKDAMAAINSGFTARTIFVYAEKPSKRLPEIAAIESTAAGKKLLDDLKHDLIEISQLNGPMGMDSSAQLAFNTFYNNCGPTDEDSEVVSHFKRRMPTHVLKTAMVYSAAESDSMVISLFHMRNAIASVGDVCRNLDLAFRGVGDSELSSPSDRVQSFIEKKGITSRNEILAHLHRHMTPEYLDRTISLLMNIGVCEYVYDKNQRPYIQLKKKKGFASYGTQP